jgi:hypothetical protein
LLTDDDFLVVEIEKGQVRAAWDLFDLMDGGC